VGRKRKTKARRTQDPTRKVARRQRDLKGLNLVIIVVVYVSLMITSSRFLNEELNQRWEFRKV
jgi:hypothetical protein